MQFVPPTHEQTPFRCSECHTVYVRFEEAGNGSLTVDGYAPVRCACGHLEEIDTLPPGRLFGVKNEPLKSYHPLTRPN